MYASSIKSTPPSADLITSFVSLAVCPTYSPTRSARVTSLNWPVDNTPITFRYFATIRAIVVFPVPGLPVKTMCIDMFVLLNPLLSLSCWTFKLSSIFRI
nr:unnamed protein product [Bacillus sp.] [Bacillus sp. (in: firmicutes)]